MKMTISPIIGVFLLLISLTVLANNQISSEQDSISGQDSTIIIDDSTSISSETDVEAEPDSELGNIIPENFESENSLFTTIARGILGLVILVLICYIFSANRKAINWKVVGAGLSIQLLLAIGILKISFIRIMFEFVGKIFVKVLDFTKAGSEFLFSPLTDTDQYGLIFAVQILPTIIFFSALTSLLFYLGIIQKIVAGLAWLLSRSLKLSGAESLYVGGKIFV
jgi:CNT family concentrative nucleoside transporter